MKDSLSKQILLSIFGLSIVLIAVVGVSYAMLIPDPGVSKTNVLNTGTISLDMVEDNGGISISDGMPISDMDGMKLMGENNVFDFSINSTIDGPASVNYEIVAEKVWTGADTQVLSDGNVRIYLEKLVDGRYVPIGDMGIPQPFTPNGSTSEFGISPDVMRIHNGNFVNNSEERSNFSDHYRLRMWVSKDTVIDDVSRSFQIKLKVYGKVL